MSHIFISHVEEDADVALGITLGLEQERYRTWCYELDSIPGPSYLVVTGQAIESSSAVVLVVSADSLGSSQMTKEVVRAHESGKPFIPVLRDIAHVEFQARQPEWREAIGAATSIRIPADGPASIVPRVVQGLKVMGIHPGKKSDPARLQEIRRKLDELGLSKKEEPPKGVSQPATWEATLARKGYETAKRWVSHPVVRPAAVFGAVAGAVAATIFVLVGLLSDGDSGSAALPPTPGEGSPTVVSTQPTPAPTLGSPLATTAPTLGDPELGTYSGTTSQGRSVEFDVIEGSRAIGRIKFDAEGECPVPTGVDPQPVGCTCEVTIETTMANPWPIANNAFSYAPGDFEFSAIFDSATTASGFLRIHTSGTPGGSAPCESGQVTWTASVQ